jgi:hypothetical protein
MTLRITPYPNGVKMFDEDDPEGLSAIFGILDPMNSDVIPTELLPKCRTFKSMSTKEMNKTSVRYFKKTEVPLKSNNTNLFGRPVESPIKRFVHSHDETFIDVPEDGQLKRHPVLGSTSTMSYDDNMTPEEEAASRLNVENIIEFDQEEVDAIEAAANDASSDIKQILLEEGAAMLMSYDTASSHSSAVLRDGLGIESDIDSSISAAIGHLLRLRIIEAYLGKLKISAKVSKKFMDEFTTLVVGDVHKDITIKAKTDKYSAVLENMQASKRKKQPKDEIGNSDTVANPMGAVRKRSATRGPNPLFHVGENSPSEDLHGYNDMQNSGMRFS